MLKDIELKVPTSRDGDRLDRFLRDSLPQTDPRSVRDAIENGDVLLDSKPASGGNRVRQGQSVRVRRIAESRDWLPLAGDVEGASIAYEDGDVVVLYKPEGIQTEPIRPMESRTLAGFFRWKFPTAWPDDSRQSPLLSRLDRDTSGLILAALNPGSLRELRRQREAGAISKEYVCRVSGRFRGSSVLKWSIESRGGDRVRVRVGVPEPDPAYWTRVKELQDVGADTVVAAEIRKGRRHQIRAHLASAGHPIDGDGVYGKAVSGRLMLHAAAVTFSHPGDGRRMTISSAVPRAFFGQ